MDNNKVNEELIKLEDERAKLVIKKRKCESDFLESKVKMVKERDEVEIGINATTLKISQLRRQFKIKGYSTRTLRKLTELEKVWIIKDRGSKCEECNSTTDLTIHHKKTLNMGGTNEMDNLKVLCIVCHKKYHRIE